MSDLQLTIIRSPLNTPEPAEQTDAKINGRTIEQDDNHAKRVRLETDDIWAYALENPLDCRYTSNQNNREVTIYVHAPETEGRLIVQFPASVLTLLFTYLDVKTIRSLMSLCQFGNRDLKSIFFTQANNVSDILYKCIFRDLSKQDRAFTLKCLDQNLLKESIIFGKAQAILDEIYSGLQGDEAMTIEQIRDTFDEDYFKGDEGAFRRHVASFNDPIYQEATRNLVERFRALKTFIQELPRLEAAVFTPTESFLIGNSANVGFFPLRIIKNPERIERLKFYEVEFVTLPPQIKDCVNLTTLHIENIKCLPPEIGQLTSLTELTGENLQCTSLPDSIVNLTKLTYINLVDPSGELPYLVDPSGELAYDYDALPTMMITFDSLTNAQKEWILTLQRNGCVIEMMNVPPQE